MMGTRDAINDWLEKRRQEARAELAAEITAWNDRRLAAEANNELPPGVDVRRKWTSLFTA